MTNPASITVRDNTGRSYTARILHPGDTYGNGAIWGAASYHDAGRLGITVDGTPATYYADQFAGKAEGQRIGAALAIDSGAGWSLTEESTLAFYQLADEAAAERNADTNHGLANSGEDDGPAVEPRYRYEFYRDTAVGETQQQTWYVQRAQWLVFDRNGVGCMASLGTEAEAALIVNALNAYQEGA